MLCSCSDFANNLLPIPADCFRTAGGIDRLIFFKKRTGFCNLPVEDSLEIAEWQDAAENCLVRMTPGLKCTIQENTFTDGNAAFLCRPSQLVGISKELTFTDYNNDVNTNDICFWNQIMLHPKNYKFAYVDCNNRVFGFYDFVLKVSEIIPETNSEFRYRSGSITWQEFGIPKPLPIPELLLELLEAFRDYDCSIA